jgi:hypothetical protein
MKNRVPTKGACLLCFLGLPARPDERTPSSVGEAFHHGFTSVGSDTSSNSIDQRVSSSPGGESSGGARGGDGMTLVAGAVKIDGSLPDPICATHSRGSTRVTTATGSGGVGVGSGLGPAGMNV